MRPLRVNIMGRMGSGKSKIAKYLIQHTYLKNGFMNETKFHTEIVGAYFNSDDVAKKILNEVQPVKERLIREFPDIYKMTKRGYYYNRDFVISSIANGDTHVIETVKQTISRYMKEKFEFFYKQNISKMFVLYETAVSDEFNLCDASIYVHAEKGIRVRRFIHRELDLYERESTEADYDIIDSLQKYPEGFVANQCTFRINNNISFYAQADAVRSHLITRYVSSELETRNGVDLETRNGVDL